MAASGTHNGNHSGSVSYFGKTEPGVAVVCNGCHGAIRLPLAQAGTLRKVTCTNCGRTQPVNLGRTGGPHRGASPFSEFPSR